MDIYPDPNPKTDPVFFLAESGSEYNKSLNPDPLRIRIWIHIHKRTVDGNFFLKFL
jgi:hypothetical protein